MRQRSAMSGAAAPNEAAMKASGPAQPPGERTINVGLLLWSLFLIIAGCVVNNVILEVIVSKKANPWADPGSGGLVTFLQFSFVALLNVGEAFKWGRSPATVPRPASKALSDNGKGRSQASDASSFWSRLPFRWTAPHVPLRHYAFMTVLFFTMSYLNNWAFKFNISQPLHMVFRSANLITTFSMGYMFFGKRYTLPQFLCVALLTAGAVSATFAEALMGDTAKAAAAAGGGAAAAPCTNCPDAAGPSTAALARQAAATAVAAAAAAGSDAAAAAAAAASASSWYMIVWLIGVGMLAAVLILQACLGNYQSWVSKEFGQHPNEGMFYMHALSLPAFLITLPDMLAHAKIWSASPAAGVALSGTPLVFETAALSAADSAAAIAAGAAGVVGLASPVLRGVLYWVSLPLHWMPVMWLYVLVNVVSQYVCIKGVYILTSMADPLTVNVTLTVRKFMSLMLSIVIFNNTFTVAHWIGAVCVFGGALWYGRLPAAPAALAAGKAGPDGSATGGAAAVVPSAASALSASGSGSVAALDGPSSEGSGRQSSGNAAAGSSPYSNASGSSLKRSISADGSSGSGSTERDVESDGGGRSRRGSRSDDGLGLAATGSGSAPAAFASAVSVGSGSGGVHHRGSGGSSQLLDGSPR